MFILPINRDVEDDYKPPVVIALIVINSLVLLATWIFGSESSVFQHYGFIPANPRQATLFTSMFIHAGFLHLLGNMWFLWMFGRRVERSFGSWPFALVYLVSGLGGGLLHYVFNRGSTVPCGGASGAISGIAGCFFILFPKANFDLNFYLGYWRLGTIPSHTTAAVGAWIGEQTLLGLLSKAIRFSSVAFWAHVGGFSTGAAAALCFRMFFPQSIDPEAAPRPRVELPPESDPYDDGKMIKLNINQR